MSLFRGEGQKLFSPRNEERWKSVLGSSRMANHDCANIGLKTHLAA